MEQESVVDGNLSTEASLIVLDTLEIIVKVNMTVLNAAPPTATVTYHVQGFPVVMGCFSPLSDGGGVRAEGECFRRRAKSAPPQHGR